MGSEASVAGTHHPHAHGKVSFDWRITFGNLLTIALAFVSAASVLIAGYVRYEGQVERFESRDVAHDKAFVQLGELIAGNQRALSEHQGNEEFHMSEKEKVSRFVSREEFRETANLLSGTWKGDRDRLEAARKADAEDMKALLREHSRAQERQFQNLQGRIDALLIETKRQAESK